MITTTRVAVGWYQVADGSGRSVTVRRIEPPTGIRSFWIAEADWDSCLFTDPLLTKTEGVEAAAAILADARGDAAS